MRIQPWMTAVASMMMLLAAGTPAAGQTPYPAGPSAGGPEGAYYYQRSNPAGGMVYQPQYGNHDPAMLYPPGTPGEFQPWPQISPYHQANVAVDQHYNSNGVWFRKIFMKEREYYGSVEFMTTWFRDAGSSTIGSPHAPIAPWGEQYPLGVPVNINNVGVPDVPNFAPPVPGFYSVDRRVFPYPTLTTTPALATIAPGRFAVRTASVIPDAGAEPGIQARWGFTNDDHTGFMMNGWWGFEGTGKYSRGDEFINGVRVNQALTLRLQGQNLSAILGHIPLDNGEPLGPLVDFGTGSTAKYDVLYELKHSTQAGGANFSIYQQPLYRAGKVTLKPLWGLRYMYIEEAFSFRGIDSGFNYTVADGSGTGTFRPVATTMTRLYDQYEARLSNGVQSQIAGPEIGLRFDLGEAKDGFKVWGETIVGLAANYEEIHLKGNNIGDPLFDARFTNPLNPRMLRDGTDASFDERTSGAHVSPLFQQSIFANIGLLDVVPLIKDMKMFEGATFRIGYTFLLIGKVARPTNSVNWQGFPLTPDIQADRNNWWMHQMNFGLDWTF